MKSRKQEILRELFELYYRHPEKITITDIHILTEISLHCVEVIFGKRNPKLSNQK
jgi:hypothetical protein